MQLATDRLVLRELAPADASRFFAIETAPGVSRYLTRIYEREDEALEYIRGIMVEANEVPRLAFDLAVTLGGEMIGRCGMKRDDAQPADAMIWYVFDPAHHGHGYATEAARALMAYAFEELKLHRVWADVDPRNPASLRVCERLGMRKEAHHIENVFIRDEWCDTVIYAVLRREWPTHGA